MLTAIEIVGGLLLVGGAAFAIVGGIGLHRLPDCFARMHAGGITDTLVATSMLAGLALQSAANGIGEAQALGDPTVLKEPGLLVLKLFAIWFFLTVTSPTSTHALARTALGLGIRPRVVEEETEP